MDKLTLLFIPLLFSACIFNSDKKENTPAEPTAQIDSTLVGTWNRINASDSINFITNSYAFMEDGTLNESMNIYEANDETNSMELSSVIDIPGTNLWEAENNILQITYDNQVQNFFKSFEYKYEFNIDTLKLIFGEYYKFHAVRYERKGYFGFGSTRDYILYVIETRADSLWISSFESGGGKTEGQDATCTIANEILNCNHARYNNATIHLNESYLFIELGGKAEFPASISSIYDFTGVRE